MVSSSPVAGIVRLDNGREVPFVIGADPDSPLESRLPEPPSLGSKPKSLTYWYLGKGSQLTMTRRAQRPCGARFDPNRGFALIELLFAVLVLVVLITFGVPSFNKAMLGAKLSGFSSQLFGAMQQARSEALKRNAVVTLCASEDGTTCATGEDWEIGWIVLSGTTVLHVQQALPEGFKVVEASGADSLTFSPTLTETTPASFTICRDSPDGSQERVVALTVMGTANVIRTEEGSCP